MMLPYRLIQRERICSPLGHRIASELVVASPWELGLACFQLLGSTAGGGPSGAPFSGSPPFGSERPRPHC